jgi:hypothetical protein
MCSYEYPEVDTFMACIHMYPHNVSDRMSLK